MSNFKTAVIEPSVKRGAELLDDILPGWAKAINVKLLRLATANPNSIHGYDTNAREGTGCILCQLDHYLNDKRNDLPRNPIRLSDFGDFSDGLSALKELVDDWDLNEGLYGFDLLDEWEDQDEGVTWFNEYDSSTYYHILDRLWKEEIEQRVGSSN